VTDSQGTHVLNISAGPSFEINLLGKWGFEEEMVGILTMNVAAIYE